MLVINQEIFEKIIDGIDKQNQGNAARSIRLYISDDNLLCMTDENLNPLFYRITVVAIYTVYYVTFSVKKDIKDFTVEYYYDLRDIRFEHIVSEDPYMVKARHTPGPEIEDLRRIVYECINEIIKEIKTNSSSL